MDAARRSFSAGEAASGLSVAKPPIVSIQNRRQTGGVGMAKLKAASENSETFCKAEVERMLKNSQTKGYHASCGVWFAQSVRQQWKSLVHGQ